MNKNKILTSMLAIMIAGPALAETFPTDGYMKENKTYDDAATYANTGVYEGSVTATAEYENIKYQIAAGKYLAQSTTTETTCPAGSYCGGLTEAYYSEEIDQGKTSCPTIDSVSYTSAAGSSLITECYTESERACSDVNTQATVGVGHVASITYANTNATGTQYAVDSTTAGAWTLNTSNACDITGMTCEQGWHSNLVPDLMTLIGTSEAGTGYVANDSTGAKYDSDNMTSSGAGISGQAMAFAVDYGTKGIVTGLGRCSTRAGASNTWDNDTYNVIQSNFVDNLTDETGTGQYCYCQLTGYTPVGGTKQSLSSSWVFGGDGYAADNCASSCASYCASDLRDDVPGSLAFRSALLGSLGASAPSCEANAITINWTDAANDSEATSSTVYEGDIKTPSAATTKPGKTFKGWKFSK